MIGEPRRVCNDMCHSNGKRDDGRHADGRQLPFTSGAVVRTGQCRIGPGMVFVMMNHSEKQRDADIQQTQH